MLDGGGYRSNHIPFLCPYILLRRTHGFAFGPSVLRNDNLSAGEGGKRTARQVLRDPEVPEAIKKCLVYMTTASKEIPNTQAERQQQRMKAQAMQVVYGAWVV